jgi:hypothetical protein
MSTVINQNTPVEQSVDNKCLVVTNAKKCATNQDSAIQAKKNYWPKVVVKDAINLERLATIGVKLLVILVKSALKFHVMLKSEFTVNVAIDS